MRDQATRVLRPVRRVPVGVLVLPERSQRDHAATSASASRTACGRSTITRWPQSATRRSLAREPARVLERVLERQLRVAGAPEDHDRAARSPAGRGADRRRSSPGRRPSCPCAGAGRRAGRAIARGVSATGSETNHGRKTARRYQTRSAHRWRKRATARPGRIVAAAITSASTTRDVVAMPAGATSSSPRTSSGRLRASRSATRPPSEWPATTARSTPSASSTAAVAAAKSSIVAPRGERPGAGVTGEVDRDHAVAPNELRQHLDPVPRRAAEPVDEQHRLALTADVVLDRARAPGLEASLQPSCRAKYPSMTMAIVGARAR